MAQAETGSFSSWKDMECRVLVVGRSGSGKSSLVNLLLGIKLCEVGNYGGSTTCDAKMHSRPRFGKELRVVDTPGLFDTRPEMSNEVVLEKLAKTALLLAPGPHAILLTVMLGQRFTKEEQDVVKQLKNFLGPTAMHHVIVVFTKLDEFERQGLKMDDYVQKATPELKGILREASNRFVAVKNNDVPRLQEKQAQSVLNMVEKMTRFNQTAFYSSEMFKAAEEKMKLEDASSEQVLLGISRSASCASLTESQLHQEIQGILSQDNTITSQSDLPQRAKEAPKGKKGELLQHTTGLLRLLTRNQVSSNQRTGVVASLLQQPVMVGILPLVQSAELLEKEKEKEFSNA